MRENIEVGEVKNVPHETKHVEWRIPGFFTFLEQESRPLHPFLSSPLFSAAGILWQLRLMMLTDDDMVIDLCNEGKDVQNREYAIKYCFCLKKKDGTMQDIAYGTVAGNSVCSTWEAFSGKAELFRRRTELMPSNILTVTCTISYMAEVPHSFEPSGLGKSKLVLLTELDKLSKNFKDLFNNKESCDVTLKVQNRDYTAHKCVLMARSSVFAATFKHDTLERRTGIVIIPDCDPDSFQLFLEYLYCGKVETCSFSIAQNLYYISEKYDVEELKTFCVEYLLKNLTVDNVCEVAIFADKYEMQTPFIVQDFFNENVFSILETSEWEALMKADFRLGNKLLKGMSPKVKRTDSENKQSHKIKKIRLN